jgi:hypothetical protein
VRRGRGPNAGRAVLDGCIVGIGTTAQAEEKEHTAQVGRLCHFRTCPPRSSHYLRIAFRSADKRLSALSDPANVCTRRERHVAVMHAQQRTQGPRRNPATCSSWRLLWAYGPLACAASH